MVTIGTIDFQDGPVTIKVGTYFGPHQGTWQGRVAVVLEWADGVLAKLSINTEHEMEPGEFVVNHDVPPLLAQQLLDRSEESELKRLTLGLFEDTGKRVSYGFVKDQPVWRLVDFENRSKEWELE